VDYEYDYLIVGAGMTADAAAKALRSGDAQASIGIVGDEPQPPYERPPLSKALWKGDKPVESIDPDSDSLAGGGACRAGSWHVWLPN